MLVLQALAARLGIKAGIVMLGAVSTFSGRRHCSTAVIKQCKSYRKRYLSLYTVQDGRPLFVLGG